MDDLFKVLTIVLKMKRSLLVTIILCFSYCANSVLDMWFPVMLATAYDLERYEHNGTVVVPRAVNNKREAESLASKKTVRVSRGSNNR